ncbi:YfhO family protein [Candidatus Poribacteria bacterium]|nr:YfhO family protein [Candidatus Poribacteria bacterium]
MNQRTKRLLTIGLVTLGVLCFLANAVYQIEKAGRGLPNPTARSVDTYKGYLPCFTLMRKTVLDGLLPLWDPYAGVGNPLAANLGLGVFYPFNWLIFLLNVPLAILAVQLLDVTVALAGMAIYLRYLKLEWPSVTLAAVLFGYTVLADSFGLGLASTLCWAPLIMWSIHRLFDAPCFSRCVLLAVFLCLCFLGGYVHYFFYISLTACIYALVINLCSWPEYRLKGVLFRFSLVGLAFALMLGAVSAQFLPTLELSLQSVRKAAETVDAGQAHWFGGFSPLETLKDSLSKSPPDNRLIMPYFGSAALLIPFALGSRDRKRVAFAHLVALGYAVLFVLSKEVPWLSIMGRIPLADSFRWHIRFIAVSHFMIAALAGIGFSVLLNRGAFRAMRPGTGRMDWFPVATVLYALGVSWLAYSSIKGTGPAPASLFSSAPERLGSGSIVYYIALTICVAVILTVFLNRSDFPPQARKAGLMIAVCLALLGFLFRDKWPTAGLFMLVVTAVFAVSLFSSDPSSPMRKAGAWALVALILVDVAPYRNCRTTVPATTGTYAPELVRRQVGWIKENAGHDRVLLTSITHNFDGLNVNAGTMYQFFSINSYYAFTLNRWKKFLEFAIGPKEFEEGTHYLGFYGEIDHRLRAPALNQPEMFGLVSWRYFVAHYMLDEAGYRGAWRLKYVSSDKEPKFYVYENQFALPRAYVVGSYIIAPDDEDSILGTIRNVLPHLAQSVVLEGGRPSFAAVTTSTRPGVAAIVRYEANEVELRVEAKEPSLVILTDCYYPGWAAYVDGVRRPIWRANYLFRAVETPSGAHTVLFKYRPVSVQWGASLSVAAIGVVLAGLLVERRYKAR